MNHLTPIELIEAVEDTLDSARQRHLDACADCRGEVTRLSAALVQVQRVEVPEPSPLFWEHFADRVKRAVLAEPSAAGSPRWWRWPVLVPLAGLALLVIALGSIMPRDNDTLIAPPLEMLVASDSDDSADEVWSVVFEIVGTLDVDAAHEVGISTSPGTAEIAALDLDATEQAELMRLLQVELGRGEGSLQ